MPRNIADQIPDALLNMITNGMSNMVHPPASPVNDIPTNISYNEDTKMLTINCLLPGAVAGSISVECHNNRLTIKGDLTIPDCKYEKQEFSNKERSRIVVLPLTVVSADAVSLNYSNGILTILINYDHESNTSFTLTI